MAAPAINVIPPTLPNSQTSSAQFMPPASLGMSAPTPASTSEGEDARVATLTYGDLLTYLTDPLSAPLSAAALLQVLTARLPTLQAPSQPFSAPTSSSRIKVENLNIPGIKLTRPEAGFIVRFSQSWVLDELQCARLWKSYAAAYGVPPLQAQPSKSNLVQDEVEHAHSFLHFVLDERLNVTRLVTAILRSAANNSDPVHPLASEIAGKIFTPYEDYLRKVLSAFQDRCTSPLPQATQTKEHRSLAATVARQVVLEQTALLELLFLGNYLQAPSASFTSSLLSTLYSTQLGTAHPEPLHSLLMDDPGLSLLRTAKIGSILLAVSSLQLDSLFTSDLVLVESPGTSLLTNPDLILSTHETMLLTPPDPSYAPIVLAWAVLLHSITESLLAASSDLPPIWLPLARVIAPDAETGPAVIDPDRRTAFEEFASVALDPGMNLFGTIEEWLSLGPFAASSSSPTLPQQNQSTSGPSLSPQLLLPYLSTIKSLLLSLPLLIQLPFLPSLPQYLSALCALFRSGSAREETAPLSLQFWEEDMKDSQRASILAVWAGRAPLSFTPLLRLLTALCGGGSSTSGSSPTRVEGADQTPQAACAGHAFHYLSHLSHHTLALSPRDIGVLWDAEPRGWVSKKPVSFPGGGVAEADVLGRVLNAGEEPPDGGKSREGVVVSWPVRWSGVLLVVELFRRFVEEHEQTRAAGREMAQTTEERKRARVGSLTLQEVPIDPGTEEVELVATALELVAALLRGKPALAEELDTLCARGQTGRAQAEHPFLELVLRMLQVVLIRTNPRSPPPLKLITPLLTILSAATHRLGMTLRLVGFLRSAEVFSPGGAFARLVASEQIMGTYAGTMDLLRLVGAVVEEARAHQFAEPGKEVHALKSGVMLQAVGFVFREIWSSFLGWRYTSLSERLGLAKGMMDLFLVILQDWALAPMDAGMDTPYRQVVDAITAALLNNQPAITPLSAILTSAPETLISLGKNKRAGERELLCEVVQRALGLVRVALLRKKQVQPEGMTLLETAMFSAGAQGRRSLRTRPITGGMVQLLFDYVTTAYPYSSIQLEAARVLYTLCRAINGVASKPSFVGSLDDAVVTVKALVQDILQNPMAPLPLRTAVWDFASATINTQQAIGSIFLTGTLRSGLAMSEKARGKQAEKPSTSVAPSAAAAAVAAVKEWEKPADDDYSLVAAALNFLDVCWQQFDMYRDALEPLRKDGDLWKTLAQIATHDIGPDPATDEFKLYPTMAAEYRSTAHDGVAKHSDLLLIKARAVHLLSLATASELVLHSAPGGSPSDIFKALESALKDKTKLDEVLSKAIESPYSPRFMAGVVKDMKPFERFNADMMMQPLSSEERQGGDDYFYTLDSIFTKLSGYRIGAIQISLALKRACALNLSWSLIDQHVALTRSWQALFDAASPWIMGNATLRTSLISNVGHLSKVTAEEKRDGDPMAAVHSTRVALVQAMIGGIGVPSDLPVNTQKELYSLMESIRRLIVHEHFPPLDSFRGRLSPPFHRPLLQMIQWCGRLLSSRDMVKLRTPQQWTIVSSAMTATLQFVVEALREIFADATTKPNNEPSIDLELLVTMFDRCTQAELHPVPALWLALCEDADLIRISLEVLSITDIGRANTNPTRQLLHPGYANHVLAFHMALTKAPVAAESLARAGVLSVYTENCLTPALEGGDVLPRDHPEDTGRSMAHEAWCMMLSVTTGLLGNNSLTSELLEAKIVMLVQSYGRQLTGALGWKVEESLNLPLLEELERTVAFFYTMAIRSSTEQEFASPTWALLSVYSEKALGLLQQLNYAVTHPNHTFSLLEPFSLPEEEFFNKDEQMDTSRSSADMIDPAKRPALAALMQRLFLITRDIMSSMTALSCPDAVIRSPELAEWWIPGKIQAPTRTAAVAIDEPASIGTLLELGNVARDTLSAITTLPDSAQPGSVIPMCTASCPAFDKSLCTSALRETLEMLLLYITAEITRGIFASGSEADFAMAEDGDTSGASRRRGSSGTSDPQQRALRGELLAELKELLSKAGMVFEKMDGPQKKGGIVQILNAHVQKRLGGIAA